MTHPYIRRVMAKLGWVPGRIERHLVCGWCGEGFDWEGPTNDTPPNFCRDTHKKRSSEARKKRKQNAETPPKKVVRKPPPPVDMNRVGRCPTPFKITFRTQAEAEATIKRVDPTMHTYRCSCGALHIGHSKKSYR